MCLAYLVLNWVSPSAEILRNRTPVRKSALSLSSAVTGLVRLLVGWLEKLQNRNRLGVLIGFQLVGFEDLRLTR